MCTGELQLSKADLHQVYYEQPSSTHWGHSPMYGASPQMMLWRAFPCLSVRVTNRRVQSEPEVVGQFQRSAGSSVGSHGRL